MGRARRGATTSRMVFLGAVLLAGSTARAEPPPTVATDRPDLANNTVITPARAVQVELGVAAGVRASPPLRPASTIRVGITERLELRLLESDDLVILRQRGEEGVGFGAKIRLIDSRDGGRWWPSFGIQPMIENRYPGALFGGRGPVASATLIMSQPLGMRTVLDLNVGPETKVPLRGERADVGVFAAASLAVMVVPIFHLYGELYADAELVEVPLSTLGADAGFIVVAHRRVAFDAAALYANHSGKHAVAVNVGMTVLFDEGMRRRPRSRSNRR